MQCYSCDKEESSREHVPPKCLFPERKDLPDGVDLRKGLITVPSCDEHNLKKSGDDEYLMYILAMNLPAETIAQHHFSTKVLRAIRRRPDLINSIISQRTPVTVQNVSTGEIVKTSAIYVNYERLEYSLKVISLGVYYNHFQMRWAGSVSIQVDFLGYLEGEESDEANRLSEFLAKAADQIFTGVPMIGENPEVFKYQIITPKNDEGIDLLMRLYFYQGCRVTICFGI